MPEKSLDWLYKQLKHARISLHRAETKYNGSCEECQEIKNLKEKINIIEWLIDETMKAV